MKPTQCPDHNNVKRENSIITNGGVCPSPLKLNKDSHVIRKSSSSSTSSPSPSSSLPQRHPVIIYTHSPKIIHTHPKDFMALVQKLTGMSRSSSNDDVNNQMKGENVNELEENKNGKGVASDDNESSSVITSEENCGGGGNGGGNNIGDGQVNSSSCYVPPPIFEPPNPYLTNNIPIFAPNSTDYLCSNQPFYNYSPDSIFFPPNIRGSISSSPTPEALNDFREF